MLWRIGFVFLVGVQALSCSPAQPVPSPAAAAVSARAPRAFAAERAAPNRPVASEPIAPPSCPEPAPPAPELRAPPRLTLQDGHTTPVIELALSASGKILATAGMDGAVRVWDTATGIMLRRIATDGVALQLSLSAAGDVLAYVRSETEALPVVATVDLAAAGPPQSLGEFGAFRVAPDGKTVAVGWEGIRIYDSHSGARVAEVSPFSPRALPLPGVKVERRFDPQVIRALAFDASGRRLAVASGFELAVLDTNGWKLLRRMPHPGYAGIHTFPMSLVLAGDDLVVLSPTTLHIVGVAPEVPSRHIPRAYPSVALLGDRLLGAGTKVEAWSMASGAAVPAAGVEGLAGWRIAASADGTTLALADAQSGETRVVDARTLRALRTLGAHAKIADAIAVRPDGAEVAVGWRDGSVDRWSLRTGELESVTPSEPRSRATLVYDDASKTVAELGGSGRLRLLDAATGRVARSWKHARSVIAGWFVPGGRQLAGIDQAGTVVAWDLPVSSSPPPAHELGTVPQPIIDVAVSPDRKHLAVLSGDQLGQVMGRQGWSIGFARSTLSLRELPGLRTRWEVPVVSGYNQRWVGFAPDGTVLLSSIQDPHVAPPPTVGKIGQLAVARDLQVLRAFDAATGRLTRTALVHTSGPIASKGNALVVGGRAAVLLDWPTLTRRARIASPDYTVTAVAAHPSRELFVVSGDSGATSLVSPATGALAASFVSAGGMEYVTLTPEGLFRSSLDGARSVAWTFASPLEGFSFAQFAAQYDQPSLVARRLQGEAVALPTRIGRPPSLSLDRARSSAGEVSSRSARVLGSVTSEHRVERVRIFVNGRAAADEIVCAASGRIDVEVPLHAGRNRVTVVAYDAEGFASNPETLDVMSRASGAARPDLWVIAVGISRYPNLPAAQQLAYADEDAGAITAALAALAGPDRAFAAIHATTLIDERATVQSVVRATGALAAMGPDDLAVVFLAGHGVELQPGEMVFLTSSAGQSRESAKAHGLGWKSIEQDLSRARGRVLVLLDACHSGHLSTELIAPNESLAKALYAEGRSGVLVFAASRGSQLSYEVPDGASLAGTRGLALAWTDAPKSMPPASRGGHGLFTMALLEALAGEAADRDRSGAIEVGELIDYATERVRAASNGKQTPWVARREMFGDFAVAPARR